MGCAIGLNADQQHGETCISEKKPPILDMLSPLPKFFPSWERKECQNIDAHKLQN